MRTLGVDVSHWEGRIDWHKAASQVAFAFFKSTDGTRFVDDQFSANLDGCRQAGLPHAPYHYFRPSNDPLAQAEHFIRTAGSAFHRYIVDVEQPERVAHLPNRLHTFLERVETLTGVKPAIYTSAGYWKDYLTPTPRWTSSYDLVVAHYTLGRQPFLPPGWTGWRMWQFSDTWSLPGCREEVDADWFNGTLEECQAWFANSTPPQPPQPAQGLRLRSLFDGLHIRQSPSLTARIVGELKRDETVEVEQLGGFDAWVRHARGWTALERNGYRYMEIDK